MASAASQLAGPSRVSSSLYNSPAAIRLLNFTQVKISKVKTFGKLSNQRGGLFVVKASQLKGSVTDEDGVSLGTMKLPYKTDLQRFEGLLFQWANSLCQGANLPFPVPLKVDKIPGGARLGFITIEDGGRTQVSVYIDCLVFPSVDGFAPMFRAIRNGEAKDKVAPGEKRIMESLLSALKKCVEISNA
uniref:DUF7148 domain-containing protein n=1 Tax=Kalanchoe fedtschenkoi TaxID=63787 RepID=A0A7N0RGA6_KALFE